MNDLHENPNFRAQILVRPYRLLREKGRREEEEQGEGEGASYLHLLPFPRTG